MNIQLIGLLISAFAGLLIFLSIIFGAVRGLKKSTFRLVWVFGFGLICLFVSGIIAKALVNIDISFLHLRINGQEISTLPQYIQFMVQSANPDIRELVTDNPKLVELCTQIATMFISLVVFEVLFWLTKWLFWPLWAILAKKFFGKKKIQNQDSGTIQRNVRPAKKHAGFGALVGLGIGLVICLFTFVPVAGINSAIMQIENETKVDSSSPGILTDMLGDRAEYLTVYEDSIIAKVFNYSGMGLLQKGMSDLLTTTTFNGYRISLSNEISNLAPVYVDYQKVRNYDLTNLNKQEITDLLSIADDAQKRLLSSGMVNSVYEEIAPYVAQKLLDNGSYFIRIPDFGDVEINNAVRDVIRVYFSGTEQHPLVDLSKISFDISKAIEIAGDLNNAGIVEPVLKGNITLDTLKTNLTTQLGENSISKLFDMKTISLMVPVVVEPGIKYVVERVPEIEFDGDIYGIEFTPKTGGITTENFKKFLSKIVINGIAVIKGIDQDSMIYIDADNFKNIGEMLDGAKDCQILSDATYESVLNYVIAFGKYNIVDMGLDYNLESMALDMFDSIQEIESFARELAYFGDAYKLYLQAEDDFEIIDIFKILDVVNDSVIYTESLDSIIDNGTSMLQDYIVQAGLPIDILNIGDIVASIRDIDSFVVEYNYIKPFVDLVTDISSASSPIDEFTLEDNIKNFGKYLDESIDSGSIILSLQNCKILLKSILASGLEIAEGFDDHIQEITNNVDNITSFKNEFDKIYVVMNTEIETIDDFKNFIKHEFVDEEGREMSALFTARLLYNLTLDIADKLDFDDIDIIDQIIGKIETARDTDVLIFNVLDQIEEIEDDIANIKNVPTSIDDGEYIENLGAQIDELTEKYNLILNDTAEKEIGDYVSEQIYQNIQNDSHFSPSQKQAVTDVYNNSEGKTYQVLFREYADALNLAY